MKNKEYSLITKKHSKNIWRKYIKCVEEYKLLKDGDIIFVPVNSKIYRFANEYLCKMLLTMSSEFKMYDIKVITGDDYSMMEKYNCNKLVAPDDFENIADNTLWEMLYNGRISSYLPKTRVKNLNQIFHMNSDMNSNMDSNMNYTIIRPLYLIHSEDILSFHKDIFIVTNELLDETLPYTQKCNELSYIRSIMERLSSNNEAVGNNVFGSVVNVDADMLPAYWLNGKKHEFLEEYNCKNRSCQ